MGIVPCCWKRWQTRSAFAEPAIGPPTGSMLGRPPGADAWIGNTRTTVRPSKMFTCIRWFAMPGIAYAAILPGNTLVQDLSKSTLCETRRGATLGLSESRPLRFRRERSIKRRLRAGQHPREHPPAHTDCEQRIYTVSQ